MRTSLLILLCALVTAPLIPETLAQVTGNKHRRGAIKKYTDREEKRKKGEQPDEEEAEDQDQAPPPDHVGRITRGDIDIVIKTQGTVRAEEVYRLKSTIEGRVQEVFAKPRTWFPGRKQLATVLNSELAALMDSKQTTSSAVLSDRWGNVYKPTPIHCPEECYVLKSYARTQKWVKPGALLVEAARRLRLIGRIPAGNGQFMKRGLTLTFWDVKDPKRKLSAPVENFILDVQGTKVQSAGTFTVLLDSQRYLDPDTEWAGEIKTKVKKNILRVPTSAVIVSEGQTYLTIRISTGVTTQEYTEVTAGVSVNESFLDLEKAKGIKLHRLEPPPIVLKAAPPPRFKQRRQEPAHPSRRKKRGKRQAAPPPRPENDVDSFPELEEKERDSELDEIFPSDNDY